MTHREWWEVAAERFEERTVPWGTPGELAVDLDPTVVQTPALDLIDRSLVDTMDSHGGRLIVSIPPQEGKSSRVHMATVWALARNPDITASYSSTLAFRNGRTTRNLVRRHSDTLGISVSSDNASMSRWGIEGRKGELLAVGRKGGATGQSADVLIIDDPVKSRAEADSEAVRDDVWEWWQSDLSTRLAPGAPVILIMTRWHDDDLAGRLLSGPDRHRWREVNIAAQAGKSDPLGRDPGEYLTSARGRTPTEWDQIRVQVGTRAWEALYQGRPSPAVGAILKREWWRIDTISRAVEMPDGTMVTTMDDVFQSWDLSFKGESTSRTDKGPDYVVGQVWGRRGATMYLLDQVRGQWDFVETLNQFRLLTAKWPQAILKIVEEKANGAALIASLSKTIPGIVPENPTESKVSRVNAVAPYIEAGNVVLPPSAPWVGGFIDECAAFPTGAHDDQVDAMTQAIKRGLIVPYTMPETVSSDDMDEDQFLADTAIDPW